MNIIDLLLSTDESEFKMNKSKDYEIKRLSEILKKKFVVTCKGLTQKQISHVSEISKDSNFKHNIIIEGCRIEGKTFKDKALMEKFNVVTPIDLLNKLFLVGEIQGLYDAINEESGYKKDAVQEIKN